MRRQTPLELSLSTWGQEAAAPRAARSLFVQDSACVSVSVDEVSEALSVLPSMSRGSETTQGLHSLNCMCGS